MHNDNIINLLKLEGVNFERLEENEESILLFFKRIDKRTPCVCGCSKLHIHDWRTQTLVDLHIRGKRISSILPFVEKFQRITRFVMERAINFTIYYQIEM